MVRVDNIEDIYNNYMALEDEKAKPYINSMAEEYGISYPTLMKKLDKFSEGLSPSKQSEYKNRKDRIKTFPIQISNENQHLNELNFEELYNNYMTMERKKVKPYISSKAEEYNISYKELMDALNNFVKTLQLSEQNSYTIRKESLRKCRIEVSPRADFLTELNITYNQYGSKVTPPRYLAHILNILNVDEKEAIEYLRKIQIDEETYNKYIVQFEDKFPEQVEYINYLKKIYEKYKSVNGPILEKTNRCEKPMYIYNLDLMRTIYRSGYSIEEYCSKTGKNIDELRTRFLELGGEEPVEIYRALESRINSKEKFYDMIYDICQNIVLGNMDVVEYYKTTKIDFDQFYSESQKIEIIRESIVLSEKISGFIEENRKAITSSHIYMDIELEGTKIISGRLITREEKLQIFRYLGSNVVPSAIYNMCLRKYLNGELDINGKVKCL